MIQQDKSIRNQSVEQKVAKRCIAMRNDGFLQSLQGINEQLPPSRIDKSKYTFSFDTIKNRIQQKLQQSGRINKILQIQFLKVGNVEIKDLKDVAIEGQDELYSQKLKSGLPIFKSIVYLRYQPTRKDSQYFGGEKPFVEDQTNIDVFHSKAEVAKLALFLQEQPLSKINLQFKDQNWLGNKYDHFPTLKEIQIRADVMAKLFLLGLYTEQQRKIKQVYKNQELQMQNRKKNQDDGETKQTADEGLLKDQVRKILRGIQERANIIAHDQFKQLNGEKAVQIKKSLEKLITTIQLQKEPHRQLRLLIAYKQKKSW